MFLTNRNQTDALPFEVFEMYATVLHSAPARTISILETLRLVACVPETLRPALQPPAYWVTLGAMAAVAVVVVGKPLLDRAS